MRVFLETSGGLSRQPDAPPLPQGLLPRLVWLVAEWRKYRQTRIALARLSERDLRDIGIELTALGWRRTPDRK